MRLPFAIAIAILSLWLPAQAGTMYKCTEGGRTTYGDRPCAGGRGAEFAVQAAPPPDPELEARLARQRAVVKAIDGQRAAEAARDERDARDAARREQQQANDKRRYCAQLRLQHQAAAENDQRAIGRARGQQRAFRGEQALFNERERARQMAQQCPA